MNNHEYHKSLIFVIQSYTVYMEQFYLWVKLLTFKVDTFYLYNFAVYLVRLFRKSDLKSWNKSLNSLVQATIPLFWLSGK